MFPLLCVLSITATSIGVHRYILPEADQIIVDPGDLRGINYPDYSNPDDQVGVVPYMVSLFHVVFALWIYMLQYLLKGGSHFTTKYPLMLWVLNFAILQI